MLKIGLTGNIGSGKSTVSKIFRTIGKQIFEADIVAKNLLDSDEVKTALVNQFTDNILDLEGNINRKKLAGIIFNDTGSMEFVNKLIHPRVHKKFFEWLSLKDDESYVLYEAAIIIETGYYSELDKTIVVTAPEEVRIERILERDPVTREEVLKRIASQLPEEDKIKHADYVIINDGKHLLTPQVLRIHERILMNINSSLSF